MPELKPSPDTPLRPYPWPETSVAPANESVSSISAVVEACPVCDAKRQGAYCVQCGHAYQDERLTLRMLLTRGVRRVFDLDAGVLHTFLQLLRDPGRVAQNYSAGIRKAYVNPFTYYLLAAAVQLFAYVLAQPVVKRFTARVFETYPSTAMFYVELWGDDAATRYAEFTSQVMQQTYTWITLFLFAVPLAIALRLMLGGKKMNLAESGVFALYTTAQMLLLTAPLTLIYLVADSIWVHQALVYPLMFGYTGYAVYCYFGRSLRTLIGGTVAVFGAFAIFFCSMILHVIVMIIMEVGVDRFVEAAQASATM